MERFSRLAGVAAMALVLLAGGCSDDDPGAAETTTSTSTGADGADAPARPSPGCGSPLEDEADVSPVEISVHGTTRRYLVTSPAGPAENPLPLVVDLHGLMEGAEVHARHSALGEFGQEHGFVTVFPHGTGDPVRWNVDTGTDQNHDVDFIDAVIDRVGSRRCIDTARVYATGLSNGAMLTSALACERPELFAAVAPVDGIVAPEPCDRERVVPILTTHGTADPILGFNGGRGNLSGLLEGSADTTTSAPADLDGDGHPATVAEWADRNGCEPEASDERIGDSIVHRSYDCPPGADVETYIVEGGGHTWPGSEFSTAIEDIAGPTTFEIDWNEVMWAFFQRFSTP